MIISPPALSFRITRGHYYGLFKNGSNYSVAKRVAVDTYTVLASSGGVTPAANDVLEVILSGTAIKARINGA